MIEPLEGHWGKEEENAPQCSRTLQLYMNLQYLKIKSLIKAPVVYRIHREISVESKTYPKPHPSIALVNTTFPWSGEKYR